MKGLFAPSNFAGFQQVGSQKQLLKNHKKHMNFSETFEFLKLFDHENLFDINYR